ncbi:hypothetical protein LDENG_00053600 [Lucifuga dentata]|nr:hypothetical protein LDENG_00053600 [Lucifuga dentata]
MINRLNQLAGVSRSPLNWFSSYLTDRSFSVAVNQFVSDSSASSCGVPQGSVLGPILFLLYMLPPGQVINQFSKISYHFYADDIQLYFSFRPDETHILATLNQCLSTIKHWLADHFLQLNTGKTEVMFFAPNNATQSIRDCIGVLGFSTQSNLQNLGVTLDKSLSLDSHVRQLTQSCFFHLRNIAKLRNISKTKMGMLIHDIISSCLDYCNALFTCLNKASLHLLQIVQNTDAWLLNRSNKRIHITPVLSFPINFRFHFKILVLTFRALRSEAPQYISDLLQLHSTSWPLRSSGHRLLGVPGTHFKTFGDRAFQAVAPKLWNDLPLSLCGVDLVDTFKKQLKTFLLARLSSSILFVRVWFYGLVYIVNVIEIDLFHVLFYSCIFI